MLETLTKADAALKCIFLDRELRKCDPGLIGKLPTWLEAVHKHYLWAKDAKKACNCGLVTTEHLQGVAFGWF
jgi:hypothetical protein